LKCSKSVQVLEIEGKKVKRQVVDGEGVNMLYNRLQKIQFAMHQLPKQI